MRAMFTLMLVCAGFAAQAFPVGYGYSEMFIMVHQLNEPGVYTVRIDDQVISNANGKFRFFDLRPGVKEVFIQRNGFTLFKGIVSIYNNSRTVAEYRSMKGLQIVQQIPLTNYNSAQQDFWYGWNYYNPNQNQWPNQNPNWNQNQNPNQWNPNNPYNPNNPNNNWNNNMPLGMDANSFAQFRQTVKNQSFDNSKVTLIKNSARTANFTSAQVADLLGELSFDSYKLDVAKYCYDFVVDKNNYFRTYEKFSFDSNVKELSNYIANRN